MKIRYGVCKIALIASASLIPIITNIPTLAVAEEQITPTDETKDIIIVTGEKTSRSLQKTDTSVSVTTAKRIRDENINNLYDIIKRTANVTDTYNANGFSIRGIRNDSVTGGGSGELATVYFDGAPLPINAITGGSALNMWDIGQVEVFRGPQSTLQGLNALAGSVIINSTDPSDEWNLRTRILASDFNERSFAIAGGGPLTDTIGFRVAIETNDFDGSIYNPTRQLYIDKSNSTTYRTKFVWRPIDDLKVGVSFTHIEHNGGYLYSYSDTSVENYWENRINYSDHVSSSESKVDIATIKADYRLSDKWSLSAIISGNNVKTTGVYDQDNSAEDLSWGYTATRNKIFTQEMRFNYKGDHLNGLIGLYHMSKDSFSDATSLTNVDLPSSTLISLLTYYGLSSTTATAAVDLYATALPVIPVNYNSLWTSKTENSAIFIDGSYKINDKLSIVGGLRYDYQDYTTSTTSTAVMAGTYPTASDYGSYEAIISILNSAIAYQVASAGGDAPDLSTNYEALLPKIGIRYQYTPEISAALTIQRGYRAGGADINTARSTIIAYDPEYTWNYEGALRTSWLDNKLTINANAYYIDWTDQQVWVNLGLNSYDNQVENAGKSHLYGLELEANHRLSNNFQYYASLGYARTKFDEFSFASASSAKDYSGSEFAYNPHVTATIGGTYRSNNGWFANLNASYSSGSFKDADNASLSEYEIDSRTIVNTKLGYETAQFNAYLYANNLFNEKYVPYLWASDNLALLGKPRTIGIILEAKF